MRVEELLEGAVVPIRKDVVIPKRSKRPPFNSIHYFFTPYVHEDDAVELDELEVKRFEKEIKMPLKRIAAFYLWGKSKLEEFPQKRNTYKFPSFINKPFNELFIVVFKDGREYLVKTEHHSNFVRGWIRIK